MLNKALAAFALIFIMSAIADAQFTTLQGWVIVTDKHSDDFEVLLNVRDTEVTIASTKVSISGRYMFTNLDLSVGSFDFVVRLDGFQEYRKRIGTNSGNIILFPDYERRREAAEQTAYTNTLLDEYARGLDEIGKRHPDLAVGHLEKVVQEIPDFYDARINLGLVYQDLSRVSEAEREFLKAHDLNSESARPLLALGRLLVQKADLEIQAASKRDVAQSTLSQARDALTEAIVLDSKLASANYYLGAVNYLSGSYADAERELKHALELNPALFPARIMLINVFVKQRQWQAALDNADTFLIENPISPFRHEVEDARIGVVRQLGSRR